MNATTPQTFAEGFMKGFSGIVGAMLNATASYSIFGVEDLTPDALHGFLTQFGVAIQTGIKTGGGIAVLLPASDAAWLATQASGKPLQSPNRLTEDDIALLQEVCEPCMGGGVSHFKEAYGKELELTQLRVMSCDPASAAALAERLGDKATSASFLFSVPPDIQTEGVLFFSRILEDVIPAPSGKTLLSETEINDILNQVAATGAPSPASAPPPPSAPSPQPAPPQQRVIPGNLDMVLDIRLLATARLGRIEMPIGDILALGPGSILEVGHLVDEPIELLVNDKLVARGEVVVVDEKFGLRITEIVSARERIESLGHS